MTTRQATWLVIAAPALLRLIWAACLGPDTNEAYYYLYTRHPAWSYFDHPPMVAVVAELGLTLAGWTSPLLGMRAGFIALFAGSTWLLARLTARAFGARAGVMAALALNLTGYYGLLIGVTANPDGPLLFFWLLTLDRLLAADAARGRASTLAWLGAGVGLGGALLSKYHAVLLPAGVFLDLAVRPAARRCLRTPGPYLGLAAAGALFAPVIWWNSRHGWASFLFQGHRAVGPPGFHPEWLAVVAGGSILFLFPWIGIPLVTTLARLVRRGPRGWSDPEALLACQAAAVLGFFLGVTPFRRVMPHWPLIGFVALMPMLGRDWSERLAARPGPSSLRRRLAAMAIAPVMLAGLIAGQARFGILQGRQGRLLGLGTPAADLTVELIIWDRVARELGRRGLLRAPGVFLFTNSWRRSAQLGYATRGAVPVACYEADARSFAFWSRPEDWVGRDGILVSLDGDPAGGPAFARWFQRIEPLGEFPILRSGLPVRTVRLYRCLRQAKPFPFRYPWQGAADGVPAVPRDAGSSGSG